MIIIGSDHGGLALKAALHSYLNRRGFDTTDAGTNGDASVDYPDFGQKVAEAVVAGEAKLGILICGTGIGMSIAANKVKGARAALVRDAFDAEMSRRHNDANVICFGAKSITVEKATECLNIFLTAKFDGGRHIRRVGMFDE